MTSSTHALELAAQKVSRARKLDAFESRRSLFMESATALNERLIDGKITPLEWNLSLRDLVKDLHISSYAIGRSGQWSDITPGQWSSHVSGVLRKQYEKLRAWASQLYDLDGVTLAGLNNRARHYANAARQSLSRGTLAELGIDPSVLPAHPADFTTECRTGCACRWAIRILSKARGDFNASWRLGSAEHCRTCRQRSKKWKGLRVRGGRLIDGFEAIFAG